MTSKPINEPPQKKETFLDRVERKAREASVKISRMRERMEFDEKRNIELVLDAISVLLYTTSDPELEKIYRNKFEH